MDIFYNKKINDYTRKVAKEIEDNYEANVFMVKVIDSDVWRGKLCLQDIDKNTSDSIESIRLLISTKGKVEGLFSSEASSYIYIFNDVLSYNNTLFSIKFFLNNNEPFCKVIRGSKHFMEVLDRRYESWKMRIRFIIYHELTHKRKNNFEELDDTYESSLIQMNSIILMSGIINSSYYYNYHDCFYFEVDANGNAIKRCQEYADAHPEEFNSHDMKYLEYEKERFKTGTINYDFDGMFTLFNKALIEFGCEYLFEKAKWYKLFYEENKLRNLSDIVNDPLFHQVDDKIIFNILSSSFFNKYLNYEDMNDYELEILLQAFVKQLACEYEKLNYNSQKDNTTTRIIKNSNRIKLYSNKINTLNELLTGRSKKR